MKIALVGYGKMGKIIEEIALKRGHEIVARLKETPTAENLNNPDVAIEFSIPEAGDDGYFLENNAGKDTITVWLTDSTLYSEQQISTIKSP